MPGHKGGDGSVPFGGFEYEDQSGQVTGGTVYVTYGNGQSTQAEFAVDQITHRVTVSPDTFLHSNPTNVTMVEFKTVPEFPANVTDVGAGEDPMHPTPGHFVMHAKGSTKPVGTASEFMNCLDLDQQS